MKHNNINQGLSPGYGLSLEEKGLRLYSYIEGDRGTDCQGIVGFSEVVRYLVVGGRREPGTDKSGQARD